MKTLIETTTGTISKQMTLLPYGHSAGRYQWEAFEILSELCKLPDFYDNEWSDIMYDKQDNVYAIWAEDAMTCSNAKCIYVRLERKDIESITSPGFVAPHKEEEEEEEDKYENPYKEDEDPDKYAEEDLDEYEDYHSI